MAIQHPRKGELYLGDNLCLGRSFVSVKGHGVTIGQNSLLKNIAATHQWLSNIQEKESYI